ncbi:hypothetical protein BKCO1_5000054 [Neofusicoccum parvum]|uniref:Uncharacterized protein n=1 Tax=Neofusicoccum parvum TaxID=310453 RepID=A0ACB5SLN4_9PEZI|nr:hypothetical protein BKCO1_5000054 [Neofusicoccum parvum]
MPATRSTRRAETQTAKKERMQRQKDRTAERMPVPPRPVSSSAEKDMLSLFGSIMHGIHCVTRQPPGQWLLTDALLHSPNALKPENIVSYHNNAEGDIQGRVTQLSDVIADAASHGVDPQVLFFIDLMVKAEKAVAQAKETRGSSIDHLSAYLKAFKRDVISWADHELSEAQGGFDTNAPDPRSSDIAPAARPAADMPPPPNRPRDAQPQRKTAQLKSKRSLIVRLKVRTFPRGNNSSTISSGIATALSHPASNILVKNTTPTTPISSGLTLKLRPNAGKQNPQQSASTIQDSSEAVTTARKRKATKEPVTTDAPASKKIRTSQGASSANIVTVQDNAGPVRRSGRKAPITVPPMPPVNAGSQQEGNDSKTNELSQPSSNIGEAQGSSGSGANKRMAPMDDADDDFVSEQPTKRRRAAASQSKANKATSKAPRAAAVKKTTKTAKATAATAASPSATPTPAPTPAPSTTHAALPPRQRNGAGPVTGRDGFELIGPEPRFKLGQNDEALLTLRFYRNDEAGNRVLDSYTWRGKTDNRTPADIDWNNPKDIKILNKWMLQYLSRTWKCNGLRPDMMSRVWMDEEFEWLAHQARHYFGWSKEDMPNQREKMEEFNEEWEGEQIPFLNMEGEEVVTQPRPERTVAAIASAMRRDEEAHPERWVGTHLEGRSKVKREGAKGKQEGEEGEEEL